MAENQRGLTPPGELINVKGRKVHVQRNGTGSPLVLFESGLYSSSLSFAKVQPEIAKITSTISYDRAGMGYSEPSPNQERVKAVFAKELCDLLEILDIRVPLVLVGWSAGGNYILEFAYQYPDRAAGMVFIDSGIGARIKQIPKDIAYIKQQDIDDLSKRFIRLSKMTKQEILNEFGNSPPWKNHHPNTHKYFEDCVHPELFEYYLTILSFWIKELDHNDSNRRSMGDIPMKVVYALENYSTIKDKHRKRLLEFWEDVQSNLAGLSSRSQLIPVNSGHDIANEKPEIVIEAIKDIVIIVKEII